MGEPDLQEVLGGKHPKSVRRMYSLIGKGINGHSMIEAGDKVLIAVSGGMDSLVLALLLAGRRRFLPIHYDLEALMIDFREHPHSEEAKDRLRSFFEELGIPFTIHTADMMPASFRGKFDCYRCGRNRRRILFDFVRDWTGTPKIALGHHLDDIVETTLMNMVLRGQFSTMVPNQPFFDGAVRVIRPLCLTPKEKIRNLSERYRLPVSEIDCPFKRINIRERFKPVIGKLREISPDAREKIVHSLTNIDREYLPRGLLRAEHQ